MISLITFILHLCAYIILDVLSSVKTFYLAAVKIIYMDKKFCKNLQEARKNRNRRCKRLTYRVETNKIMGGVICYNSYASYYEKKFRGRARSYGRFAV